MTEMVILGERRVPTLVGDEHKDSAIRVMFLRDQAGKGGLYVGLHAGGTPPLAIQAHTWNGVVAALQAIAEEVGLTARSVPVAGKDFDPDQVD